jgi:hypothetical protein
MQEKEIQAGPGGSKTTRIPGQPDGQGGTTETGELQPSANVSPFRGDSFLTVKNLKHKFSMAELADFSGELEGVGDHPAILKMCRHLLPAVQCLPTWKEKKWDNKTTAGQVMAHIADVVYSWRHSVWDTWGPMTDICYGDPRESDMRYNRSTGRWVKDPDKGKDPAIWILWAYRTEQLAITPSMAFLHPLRSVDKPLYNIICTILGKLYSDTGIQLWDHYTDELADDFDTGMNSMDEPTDDPDPEFGDGETEENESEYKQRKKETLVDIKNYWNGAKPVIKECRKMKKTSMKSLKRMVSRYRWNTAYRKKLQRWILNAIEIIETKKSLFSYSINNLVWLQDEIHFHPPDYIWFRWFGEYSPNYMECRINDWMESNYNEGGGFYPMRSLFRYTTPEAFKEVSEDPFPKQVETLMTAALTLFNDNTIKTLKRR